MAPRQKAQASKPTSKTTCENSSQPASMNKGKIDILPFQWNKDNWKLAFALLTEVEKADNRKVLCGKAPKEKIKGDTKSAVYRCIAQQLFPDIYKLSSSHVTLVAERVRAEIDVLFKKYKDNTKCLYKTGDGVGGPDSQTEDKYAVSYVGSGGPDASTVVDISNIWDEIIALFPPFKRLHKLLSGRPNMVPPIDITGVGPNGRESNHYQPTEQRKQNDDAVGKDFKPDVGNNNLELFVNPPVIDPLLLEMATLPQCTIPATPSPDIEHPEALQPSQMPFAELMNSPTPSPTRPAFDAPPVVPVHQAPATGEDKENDMPPLTQAPASTQATPAKNRNALANAIQKVNGSAVKHVPAKRTFKDRLFDMHQENLQLAKEKAANETNVKKQKVYLQEREILARQQTSHRKDYDNGLMTKERYLSLMNKLIERDEVLADRLDEMDNMDI